MARLTCKPSVRFKAFTPALLRILTAAYAVASSRTDVDEVVITSSNDSKHAPKSRHYSDEALDFRLKNFPTADAKRAFVAALRAELGPAFTVLHEDPGGPHQHAHAQPRIGTVYNGPS